MPLLLKTTMQTGRLYRQIVSTSMPEKPKALSPSTASTGLPVSTAAAMAKPMPTPMTPQVPTSRRLRGLYMSMTPRARSSVLAPSLTRIASGRSLMMVRSAPSALWKSIGAVFFMRRGAILAMFSSLRALTAEVQSAGGAGHLLPIASTSADTQDPISPTNGATIATLLSISLGSMSIWMNFFDPGSPQVLPLPCDSSQLRRAPIIMTTSESLSTVDRAAPADSDRQQALGHAHLQERNAARLDQRADGVIGLHVSRAFAQNDQRAL